MASSHEERAQSAAQKAADELHAASRQDQQQVGEEEAPAAVRHAADKARGVRDAAADRTADDSKAAGDDEAGSEEEEDVMLRVKDADQMTGQAFNDVGKMGEEGTGVPRRRRSN